MSMTLKEAMEIGMSKDRALLIRNVAESDPLLFGRTRMVQKKIEVTDFEWEFLRQLRYPPMKDGTCAHLKSDGTLCRQGASKHDSLCSAHRVSDGERCSHIRPSGKRCGRKRSHGETCFQHHPHALEAAESNAELLLRARIAAENVRKTTLGTEVSGLERRREALNREAKEAVKFRDEMFKSMEDAKARLAEMEQRIAEMESDETKCRAEAMKAALAGDTERAEALTNAAREGRLERMRSARESGDDSDDESSLGGRRKVRMFEDEDYSDAQRSARKWLKRDTATMPRKPRL